MWVPSRCGDYSVKRSDSRRDSRTNSLYNDRILPVPYQSSEEDNRRHESGTERDNNNHILRVPVESGVTWVIENVMGRQDSPGSRFLCLCLSPAVISCICRYPRLGWCNTRTAGDSLSYRYPHTHRAAGQVQTVGRDRPGVWGWVAKIVTERWNRLWLGTQERIT